MRFLRALAAFFRRILLDADSAAAVPPPDGGTLCARFLNSDRKYNRAQGRATYRAFEASFDPDENAIVLSMYRLNALAEPAINDLGRSVLGLAGGRLHGRAELRADEIQELPLDVEPAKKFRARFDAVPDRHVTVGPWDDDKAKRKLHAMDLAKAATLLLLE